MVQGKRNEKKKKNPKKTMGDMALWDLKPGSQKTVEGTAAALL